MYRNTVQNPHKNVLKDKPLIKCKENGRPAVNRMWKANALGMTVFTLQWINSTLDFEPNGGHLNVSVVLSHVVNSL